MRSGYCTYRQVQN